MADSKDDRTPLEEQNHEIGGGAVIVEPSSSSVEANGDTAAAPNENDTAIEAESPQSPDSTDKNNEDKSSSNENHVALLDLDTDAEETSPDGEDDDAGDKAETTSKKVLYNVVLPACVVRFMKPRDALVSDYDYFEAMVAVETLRSMAFKLTKAVPGSFTSIRLSTFGNSKSTTLRRGNKLMETFQGLLKKLEAKRAKLLEAMEKRPVVEKLLDALEAKDLEKKIFRNLLVRSSGMGNTSTLGEFDLSNLSNFGSSRSHGQIFSMCTVREMFAGEEGATLAELMPMVDSESSTWLKEQLYVRATTFQNFSGIDDVTMRVLMGLEITPAQYRKIGSSLLQKVLSEDPVFLQSKTGKAIKNQKKLEKADSEAPLGEALDEKPSFFVQAMEAAGPPEDSRAIKKDRIFDVLSLAAEQEKSASKDDPVLVPRTEDEAKTEIMADKADEEEETKEEEHDEDAKSAKDEFGPYKSELAYLEEQIMLMRKESSLSKLKISLEDRKLDEDDFMDSQGIDESDVYYHGYDTMPKHIRHLMMGRTPTERLKEEKKAERLERSVKQLREKVRIKIAASKRKNGRDFRLEQLCTALHLENFEKYCLLEMLKSVIAPGLATNGRAATPATARSTQVGALIESFCSTLEEKMKARRFFYKSGTLIQEGILTLSQQDFMTDLTNCIVELDRRLFDYLVGLDTEMSEIVDGSHLYLPSVELDDVVIPKETKKRVCDVVLNFEKVKERYYEYEIDKKITYGLGQVLLFYGNSGTGKTMLANAVAAKLEKKILLVNFPTLGGNTSGAILKFLFREARINRAVLFFDECESLFLDRDKGGSSVNMLLTELERFDGLCILATNRAHDLDEAMYRRISLAIEFRKPDHIMREEIWKTLQPPKVPLDDDINFGLIAKKYELTGGLIKNAWLQSLGLMVQHGRDKISQDDLMQAAGEQVIGQLTLEDFDRRVVPTCGLESMVLAPAIKDSLSSIVQYTKAQSVLFGQWGFEKIHRSTTGISTLFTGVPGTGKSMAAEAIGFDLGRPLLVVNVAELVSKWVGETGKNIQAIFADAKKKDAVLVFDEAEGLFGARSGDSSTGASRHDTMNVGLLLQYIENHPGVVIVITNMKNAIDDAFFRRFRFVLDFEMPDVAQREELWKSLIPSECPLDSNVSIRELAFRFAMCGGDIKNSLLRAATQAALRANEEDRKVTMSDLTTACEAEVKKTGDRKGDMAMYS